MQLVPIEDCRRGCDPFQLELLDQLFARENLAGSPFCAPAKQSQIIRQRLGQNSHLAEAGNRRSTMAFGKALPVAAQDGREMRKLRRGPTECLINSHLPGSVRNVIVAADDMSDMHERIV